VPAAFATLIKQRDKDPIAKTRIIDVIMFFCFVMAVNNNFVNNILAPLERLH